MHGYRLPTETEQLRLFERLEVAIERRKPVLVTYFEQQKDDDGKPLWLMDGRPSLVKTTRVIEPYELGQSKEGHLFVRTVDRMRMAEEKIAFRTVRIDRIAVSLTQGIPLMRVRMSDTFKVPNPHLPKVEANA